MQIRQFVEFRRCGMNLTFSLLKVFVVYNSIRLFKGVGERFPEEGIATVYQQVDTNVTLVPELANRNSTF